jgi:predicted alpha/beta hydrolase family esterase
MPRQILFVQGAGEAVHDTWDDKLVLSLERELGRGYAVRYPRMPHEGDPHYSVWKTALLNEFDELENGAVLIGHSVGGAVLLHVLAVERLKFSPGALFLIAAPFIGEGGWPSDDISPCTDLADRLPTGMPVFLYHGSEDPIVPFAHVQLHAKAVPQAMIRVLSHRDHQLNNDLGEVARDIQSISSLSFGAASIKGTE